MNFMFTQVASYNDTPYAKIMVHSILRQMPGSIITQMSDKDARVIPGVSLVMRGNYVYQQDEYARMFFTNLVVVNQYPSVYCDADMIFMGDVTPLFDDDFDMAICRRPPDDGTSLSYRVIHPYNIGFMLFKNDSFLKICQSVIGTFFGGSEFGIAQHVVGLVVNSGEFKIKFLDGNIYNRMPKDVDDFDPSVKVWHFKGNRKNWMPAWVEKHGNRTA